MQNWAIIIGINDYEHLPQDQHLKYAVKDAQAIKEFLLKNADFPSENILFCSDNSYAIGNIPTRPSRTNLRRILREEIRRANGADNFWFFFAGHGISKDSQDYLLPYDGYSYDEGSAVSIKFVIECLRQCNAKNIVLILDMCRDSKPQLFGSRGVTAVGQDTINITQQQGLISIFSCGVGNESYEINELKQGAFTYIFLKGLSQYLTLRELEKYLIKEVPILNQRYKKPIQVPLVVPEPGWKYDLPLLKRPVPDLEINHDVPKSASTQSNPNKNPVNRENSKSSSSSSKKKFGFITLKRASSFFSPSVNYEIHLSYEEDGRYVDGTSFLLHRGYISLEYSSSKDSWKDSLGNDEIKKYRCQFGIYKLCLSFTYIPNPKDHPRGNLISFNKTPQTTYSNVIYLNVRENQEYKILCKKFSFLWSRFEIEEAYF